MCDGYIDFEEIKKEEQDKIDILNQEFKEASGETKAKDTKEDEFNPYLLMSNGMT